jgi:hypothetical protein
MSSKRRPHLERLDLVQAAAPRCIVGGFAADRREQTGGVGGGGVGQEAGVRVHVIALQRETENWVSNGGR